MDENRKLLEEMGFYEVDGWLAHPKMDGEKIFCLTDKAFGYEGKSKQTLCNHIMVAAFNAGVRWQRENGKQRLIQQLKEMIKDVENI